MLNAFDNVDRKILFNRLVFSWFILYLKDMGDDKSEWITMTWSPSGFDSWATIIQPLDDPSRSNHMQMTHRFT